MIFLWLDALLNPNYFTECARCFYVTLTHDFPWYQYGHFFLPPAQMLLPALYHDTSRHTFKCHWYKCFYIAPAPHELARVESLGWCDRNQELALCANMTWEGALSSWSVYRKHFFKHHAMLQQLEPHNCSINFFTAWAGLISLKGMVNFC